MMQKSTHVISNDCATKGLIVVMMCIIAILSVGVMLDARFVFFDCVDPDETFIAIPRDCYLIKP